MYLSIFQSIEKCRLIHFYYDGYFRVVEPHVFGADRRHRDCLYGYQLAGADALGKHVGWKCFFVEHMHHIHILDAQFAGPHKGFKPDRLSWDRIYISLDRSCMTVSPPAVVARG